RALEVMIGGVGAILQFTWRGTCGVGVTERRYGIGRRSNLPQERNHVLAIIDRILCGVECHFGWPRNAVEEALGIFAAVVEQHAVLIFGLDAFGHGLNAEALAEFDDHADDDAIAFGVGSGLNEVLVDLD